MRLDALTTRLRQGNALDAAYNRIAAITGRPRRLLRVAYPNLRRRSSRRLHRLVTELPDVRSYLEIGLASGATFETVLAPARIGVDPAPAFDVKHLPAGTRVFVGTSEDFFRSPMSSEIFDVAFVDGLHTYEQTYRDVINAFRRLAPGGVVLVDDVVPSDEFSALRDPGEALAARQSAGGRSLDWHGDVYKLLSILRDHHPEIFLRTAIEPGNPQTVLWTSPSQTITAVAPDVLAAYRDLDYAEVFSDGIPTWFRPGHEDEALSDAIEAGRTVREQQQRPSSES